MKRSVAIFEPEENLSIKDLNDLYHEQIDEAASDPNTHFIISYKFLFAIRYLEKKRYRNVVIYHILGDNSKHSFKKKEGFTSNIEIQEAMLQDSSEQIVYKKNG